MFSIRGWLAVFLALWGSAAAGQDIAGLNQPATKENAATVPVANELVTFEHRTYPTEPPARRYSDQLNRNLGTPFRFFRPYRLVRGPETGLWSVQRYNLR